MFLLLNIFIIASSSSQSRERRVRLISGLQRCFKIHHPVLPFRPSYHATNNDEDDHGGGEGDDDDGDSGDGDGGDHFWSLYNTNKPTVLVFGVRVMLMVVVMGMVIVVLVMIMMAVIGIGEG